jgi:hypothetical protein
MFACRERGEGEKRGRRGGEERRGRREREEGPSPPLLAKPHSHSPADQPHADRSRDHTTSAHQPTLPSFIESARSRERKEEEDDDLAAAECLSVCSTPSTPHLTVNAEPTRRSTRPRIDPGRFLLAC